MTTLCPADSKSVDADVAAVPKPRLVLTVAPLSRTKFDPSPTMKPLSVVASPAMSCSCASSRALATVPEARAVALRAVNALPFAAFRLPLASRILSFSAGSVQKTVLVPDVQLTALSLLELCRMVVLASVVPDAVYVPMPTSKSVPSEQQ